jgi:hypothetical protein
MTVQFTSVVPLEYEEESQQYPIWSLLVTDLAIISNKDEATEFLNKMKLGKTYQITIHEIDVPLVEK